MTPPSRARKANGQSSAVAVFDQISRRVTLALTPVAYQAFEHAASRSSLNNSGSLGSYELLLGLCKHPKSASHQVLKATGIDHDHVEKRGEFLFWKRDRSSVNESPCTLTPRVEKVLIESEADARERADSAVSTLHLLNALLSQQQGVVAVILEQPGRGITPVINAVDQAFQDDVQDRA